MAEFHITRLLSLADIAREAKREHGGTRNEVSGAEVGQVVEAISASSEP
jgi:hypothetical protein